MSKITPRLYVGNYENAQNLDFLRSKNIDTIVNCSKELNNAHSNHFNYIRLELQDIPSQDLSHVLNPVSEKIIELIKDKKNVFVHCYAGISRSTSVVINTIMKLHDWDFEKSIKFVKKMHPNTNPNPGFIKQLSGIIDDIDYTELEEQPDESNFTNSEVYDANIGQKTWKSMKFDSPEEDMPKYTQITKGRRKSYANIFT